MKRSPIQAQPWKRRVKPVARPGSTIDAALRQTVRSRAGGRCELCAEPLGAAFECHHRKLRSRGGLDSACNLLALDGLCHRRVHSHVTWATEHGFLVAGHDDPATVPVAVHLTGWRLLTPSGTYRESA